MHTDLSQTERTRRQKLLSLEELGIEPYPSHAFPTNTTTKTIHARHKSGSVQEDIALAGRIMARRVMGKTCFITLQDAHGKIQLYIQRDTLCTGDEKTFYNTFIKKLLDIGDIIGVQGTVFSTHTGETSIKVASLKLLSKSLKPLPDVKEIEQEGQKKRFNDFTNPEHRYRQRYVDLIVNPHVRDIFRKRAKIIQLIRQDFDKQGYLEVETPILQPLYGGAAANPFTTYHKKLDQELYLRISNELYLKRLIVGGYDGVYEFAKDFRNEGMSRFHNPEFTQVEVYVPYQDYQWMMQKVEALVHHIVQTIHNSSTLQVGEHTIDFAPPWKRFTMYEAITHFTGLEVASMDDQTLKKTLQERNIPIPKGAGRGKLLDQLFGATCEPKLIQPTFITDYPVETSPLAKKHRNNPALVERFEVICNGKEICNAFSELNDPIDQRKRFEAQVALAKQGDDEAMALDEDFLSALSYGMPPTVGLGLGIDRLTMLITNQPSIQEVIFFPQMRSEKP